MYFYLFDTFLNKTKYGKVVAKIETRLVDLGIDGKIVKLTVLKSMHELVKEAIKKGAKTIVVVGNDKTLNQVIGSIADEDVTLGFIPVGPQNQLAQLLGIPPGELACDVLSSRLIEKIDLGKVNNQYFLSSIFIANSKNIVLECDDSYQITPVPKAQINICNFGYFPYKQPDPKDNVLETLVFLPSKVRAIFKPRKKIYSLFYNKKLKIQSSAKDKSLPLLIDGIKILKTPATVEIIPRKLKIIVGKKRQF